MSGALLHGSTNAGLRQHIIFNRLLGSLKNAALDKPLPRNPNLPTETFQVSNMPDVETSFKFLKWLDLYRTEKPFVSFIDIPEDAQDKRDNNLHFEDRTTKVSDIRSNELKYTLDDHGFMVRWNKIDLPSYDSQNVRASYLPEVEKLLKEAVDGVDEVFFFDWRVFFFTATRDGVMVIAEQKPA